MKEPSAAPRTYANAAAFRAALEARLGVLAAADGTDLQSLRQQVSFDRLLARVCAPEDSPWLLKGGYAMVLRLPNARTTRDVDLSLPTPAGVQESVYRLLGRLQERARVDLRDFFIFEIGTAQRELRGAPEGGARFPVTATVAGRNFTRFHLDVGLGDAFLAPAERLQGRDWLGFAGIEAPRLSAISREQQFAEKFHAYTLPRPDSAINTRVKDLVDMLLLRQDPGLDPARLRQAIQATFARRHTHSPPARWSEPPTTWAGPFSALARQCGLALTLAEASHQLAAGFTGLDPGFPPSSTGPR